MTVIDLDARRRLVQRQADKVSACIRKDWGERLTTVYTCDGRELAELAHPIIEPFRICEPELEQHLKGAFLRWQLEVIKARHKDDGQVVVGTAIAISVQAFTDRMIELQHGFDPNDGGFAA